MSNTDANKKIVTEFIDGLLTRGDLGAVDAYLSEDVTHHNPPLGMGSGRDGLRTMAAMIRQAFPD